MLRAQAQPYLLGGGDRVKIRVITWQAASGQYELWSAISDIYTVQSDGTIFVPLAGRVPASGITTADLAETLTERLQKVASLIEPPGVSAEVSEYRPFYITGDVARPGPYPAAPGLTVQQAAAIAGGGATAVQGVQSNTVATLRESGALRQASLDMIRAEIKAARLRAEVAGTEAVDYPDHLKHPDGTPALQAILDREDKIFSSRQAALALETETLVELKELLESEIRVLETSQERVQTMMSLAEENFGNIERLVEQGLARSPQLAESQRALFDLERRSLEMGNSVFQARQRIKEADRDIVALKARQATQAATDLQNVNGDIERQRGRRAMLARVIAEYGGSTGLSELPQFEPLYFVTATGGDTETVVLPGALVNPGDLLRVVYSLADQTLESGETGISGAGDG